MSLLLRMQVRSSDLFVCICWSWSQVVPNQPLVPNQQGAQPPLLLLLRPPKPRPKAANRTLGQLLVVSLEELSSSELLLASLSSSCAVASPDHPNQLPHTVLFHTILLHHQNLWWLMRLEKMISRCRHPWYLEEYMWVQLGIINFSVPSWSLGVGPQWSYHLPYPWSSRL